MAATKDIVDNGRGNILRTFVKNHVDEDFSALRFDKPKCLFLLGLVISW